MHLFHKFILAWNSTCFGQFLCPSSGVYSLHTQQWYMSYGFVDSFRAGPGLVLYSWLSGMQEHMLLNKLSVAARFLGLRVRIRPTAWRLSLVKVVCRHVELCVSGRSLVQRSPIECGASECVKSRKWGGRDPLEDCCVIKKKVTKF